jgi:hypothetical protein
MAVVGSTISHSTFRSAVMRCIRNSLEVPRAPSATETVASPVANAMPMNFMSLTSFESLLPAIHRSGLTVSVSG